MALELTLPDDKLASVIPTIIELNAVAAVGANSTTPSGEATSTAPKMSNDNTNTTSYQTYKRHITHGVLILHDACQLSFTSSLLPLSTSEVLFKTSSSLMHRFYRVHTMSSYDVWEVAIASFLVVCKCIERPLSLQQCVTIFHTVWLKRVNYDNPAPFPEGFLMPHTASYGRWKNRAIEVEGILLTTVGFALYPLVKDVERSEGYVGFVCDRLGVGENVRVKATEIMYFSFCCDYSLVYGLDLISLVCVGIAGAVEGVLNEGWEETFVCNYEEAGRQGRYTKEAWTECTNGILGLFVEGGVGRDDEVVKGYLTPINGNTKIYAD